VGTGNHLLDALRRECPDLHAYDERVEIPSGIELAGPTRASPYVYFPVTGVVSIIVRVQSGVGAEVYKVGREGLLGVESLLGMPTGMGHFVQQAGGQSVRIPLPDFLDRVDGSRRATRLVQAFSAYALRYAQQSAACNALHSVEQRACRWLLGMADRVDHPTIVATQELLADMLGVRRQTVGEVAVELQRSGAIAYRRSDITIVDRAQLESRACECFAATRAVYRGIVEPLL
jgi:CRP-like cAMP-binding protein